MIDMDAFAGELRAWLRDELGPRADGLADEAPLFADGLLDSFSMLALVSWIEKTAGIKFGVLDVTTENLENIATIVEFARKRLG